MQKTIVLDNIKLVVQGENLDTEKFDSIRVSIVSAWNSLDWETEVREINEMFKRSLKAYVVNLEEAIKQRKQKEAEQRTRDIQEGQEAIKRFQREHGVTAFIAKPGNRRHFTEGFEVIRGFLTFKRYRGGSALLIPKKEYFDGNELTVPENQVGHFIGKGGRMIREIQEYYGRRIRIRGVRITREQRRNIIQL